MPAPVLLSVHSPFTDLANVSYSDSQHKHTLSKLQHFNRYIHFHIQFYIVMNSDRSRKGTKNCSKEGSNQPQIQIWKINITQTHLVESYTNTITNVFHLFIYLFTCFYIYSYLTVSSVSQDCTVFKSRTINEK